MKYRRLADAQNRRAMELFAALGRTPKVVEVRDWGDLRRTKPNEVLLPKRLNAEHGTVAAYKQHLRERTTPCASCRKAHNLAELERLERRAS